MRISDYFGILSKDLNGEETDVKTKYWIVMLAAILVISAGASALLFLPGKEASCAQIISGGAVYRTVNLNADQQFTVSCSEGFNTVTVKGGKIAVTEASCPDHYCIRQGFCNGGRDIVCLPNALVISFVGEQEIDGQIG